MTRIARVALLLLALALGSGCARSPSDVADFMAPADVTGTWQSLEGIAIRLELEQRGAKFPGQMFVEPSASSAGVEIEGPVSADVFRFSRGGASDFGVMTVNGDDMSGHIPAYSRGEIRLQRVRSSSPKP